MTERFRVLVIDDDPGIRDYLETLASRQGYDVTAVADGEEVMKPEFPPRVPLSDFEEIVRIGRLVGGDVRGVFETDVEGCTVRKIRPGYEFLAFHVGFETVAT